MTRIFLIRHGENEYTRTGRLAGWTRGVALNASGTQQALALAAYLAATPVHFIYSSPLQRALETAQPLAKSKHLRVRVLEPANATINSNFSTGKYVEDGARYRIDVTGGTTGYLVELSEI